jgi:hypothetical protein
MRREYEFTDEQVEQTKVAFDHSVVAMRELWTKFREQEQAQREDLMADMKNILSPEQFEKWERDFKERTRRMRPSGPGRPGGPGKPGGPGGPDRHRSHGPRGMGGPEPPPIAPPNEVPIDPPQ